MDGPNKLKDWHKEIDYLKTENKQLVSYQQDLEEALANIREELLMDFHDNLGGQLARLAMFAGSIKSGLESSSPETTEALVKIQQMSTGLSGGVRDFIWSIDPKNDNLREVFFYLKDFGEELFEHTGIRFLARVDDMEKLNCKLFHSYSRHLIPIFKEGMTNSFRHAECREVTLTFSVGENKFVIKLEDDGKGIENKRNAGERGVKNIYKRSGEIHCAVKINSIKHKGTTITLKGSLPQRGEPGTTLNR